MSRVALVAVSLAGLASAMPFEGALEWMKQHGQEVMDTTEHCMEALKMTGNLKDKCGNVFEIEVLGTYATWGLLDALELAGQEPLVQELMNSTFVKSAKVKAMQSVREKEHQGLQDFCGKADCVAGLDSLAQEYGSCYAGTLCKSITEQNSKLDYSKCRNVLQAWMPRAFRTQQRHLCEKEGDVYCNEVVTSVMLQQSTLTCWEMFYKTGPAAVELCRAKPDCMEPWKIEQRKFPKCVKLLENQIKEQAEQSMGMARELLMTAKEPEVRHAAENWRPKSLSTFMEVCLSEAHMVV